MTTLMAKKETFEPSWYLVDASNLVLGRLASKIASVLRGKHKASYTPHMDAGDYVIVVNASQMRFTGNKLHQKTYYRHSGYPGGLKSITLSKMLDEKPTKILEEAIKGMLPKNSLGRQMFKKLKVYESSEHPHSAQCPKPLKI